MKFFDITRKYEIEEIAQEARVFSYLLQGHTLRNLPHEEVLMWKARLYEVTVENPETYDLTEYIREALEILMHRVNLDHYDTDSQEHPGTERAEVVYNAILDLGNLSAVCRELDK